MFHKVQKNILEVCHGLDDFDFKNPKNAKKKKEKLVQNTTTRGTMVSNHSRMPTYCKRHRTRDFIYMQKSRRRGPIFFSLLFNLVFFSWQLSLSFLTYPPVSRYSRYLKLFVARHNLCCYQAIKFSIATR